MFQFPGFPAHDYFIHHALRDSSSRGFPHSDIRGSMLICSSPRLFAACHVLRRLPMPRHPPYALVRLNYLKQSFLLLWFSLSLELLCSYLQFLWQNCFSFTRRKNLISERIVSNPLFLSCFPVFPVMYASHAFFRIHMMILSYSVFNEHPPLSGFSTAPSFFRIKRLRITIKWAQVDSNHRPRAYQARALTS